jgi:Rrf2 family protein
MSENKRFVVGLHVLTALALTDRDTVSSDELAWSANMNAAAVRRILSQLRDAGLVRSKPGPSGGFALGGQPEEITLLDVYLAVGLGPPFRADQNDPNPECPIGGNIRPALSDAFEPIQMALHDALAGVTLADIGGDVRERMAIEPGEYASHSPDSPL